MAATQRGPAVGVAARLDQADNGAHRSLLGLSHPEAHSSPRFDDDFTRLYSVPGTGPCHPGPAVRGEHPVVQDKSGRER